jgi:hypothetical protein
MSDFWKDYEPEPTRPAIRNAIDMAREAGFMYPVSTDGYMGLAYDYRVGKETGGSLKAFEALVRADEREKYKWDVHSCGPTCKRYACVAMREAIEAEREACAKVCEMAEPYQAADLIRARGNT